MRDLHYLPARDSGLAFVDRRNRTKLLLLLANQLHQNAAENTVRNFKQRHYSWCCLQVADKLPYATDVQHRAVGAALQNAILSDSAILKLNPEKPELDILVDASNSRGYFQQLIDLACHQHANILPLNADTIEVCPLSLQEAEVLCRMFSM